MELEQALPKEQQVLLIQEQQSAWRNDLERLRIQARVARVLDDNGMLDNVKKMTERCVKALEELDKMLKELA